MTIIRDKLKLTSRAGPGPVNLATEASCNVYLMFWMKLSSLNYSKMCCDSLGYVTQ